MLRLILTFTGVALLLALIADFPTDNSPLAILIVIATFFAGCLGNLVIQFSSQPRLKINIQPDARGCSVKVDNCDYCEAVEPKVFFDLVILQADGCRFLVESEATSFSHLPARPKGRKHSSIIVPVPVNITSKFTEPQMQLVIGATSIHRRTNSRGLILQIVPFSEFYALASDVKQYTAA